MSGWVRFDRDDVSSWPAVEPGVRGLDVLIFVDGEASAAVFYVDRRGGGPEPVFEDEWRPLVPSHWMAWPAPPDDV